MEPKALKPLNVWTTPFLLCPTGIAGSLQVSDYSNIETELFSYIEHLAEVKEKGLERIKSINEENATEENWLSFQAFVRQAKLYYFSAKNQNSAISALNLFYSFENLVKAYCSLYHPAEFVGKIRHGIGTGNTFSDAFSQEISIYSGMQIMPVFYELVTGKKIDSTAKIDAEKLLAYCYDIFYEYHQCSPTPVLRVVQAKAVVAGESQEKAGLLIAVSGLALLLRNNELKDIFNNLFNKVELPQNLSDTIFKISLNDHSRYSFLQTKEDFPIIPAQFISADFYDKFLPYVSFYPRKGDAYFNLNLPVENNAGESIVMNECIAIYMLMFYMSELVRYNPKIIQENLSKNQGWLMERFIVNTPQTFLRYMVNLITGEDFIFTA